ncbi:hypothetical protein J2S43_006205 [Catenuloplanes nepalensis]|uniref:Copper chaperone PCu(A)C n=1 Tax=Catenuloplanes nepalensis TaxID=587533 RepID=A0ABT9N1W6_9ACTN|nr:hypothetical protein [Catenuloplanes nepalensis]MDP9797693.1 hypothetical protein [Catenuloplanes nepalensis]
MRTIYRWRWVAMSVAALAMTALLGGLSVRADATTAEKPVAPSRAEETFRFRLRSEPVEAPAPGSTTPLHVRLTNPHDERVRIDELAGHVLEVSRPDCHATAADLAIGLHSGPPGLPFTLGPGESVDAGTIPVFVPAAVSAACRTATYQFLITGTGIRLPISDSA